MNTKILDRIIENVRFSTKVLENGKTEYLVERKSREGGWDVLTKTIKLKKALIRKHNAWHAQLHLFHYTSKLFSRRKYGKGSFLKLLRK